MSKVDPERSDAMRIETDGGRRERGWGWQRF
jgi:hypothetical protein